MRQKIRATVKDPKTAELLCPNDHPIGTKRLILDTDYYETYNRDNVTLVDISSAPIEEITPAGLRTADAEYALDAIVFATGFDAMTGAMKEIDIRTDAGRRSRRSGRTARAPISGIMMAGLPEPVHDHGAAKPRREEPDDPRCEQHVDWIADCLPAPARPRAAPHRGGAGRRGRLGAAHQRGGRRARSIRWRTRGTSGANIPGKPRVFMPYVGGVTAYKKKCDEVAAKGYEGFILAV